MKIPQNCTLALLVLLNYSYLKYNGLIKQKIHGNSAVKYSCQCIDKGF